MKIAVSLQVQQIRTCQYHPRANLRVNVTGTRISTRWRPSRAPTSLVEICGQVWAGQTYYNIQNWHIWLVSSSLPPHSALIGILTIPAFGYWPFQSCNIDHSSFGILTFPELGNWPFHSWDIDHCRVGILTIQELGLWPFHSWDFDHSIVGILTFQSQLWDIDQSSFWNIDHLRFGILTIPESGYWLFQIWDIDHSKVGILTILELWTPPKLYWCIHKLDGQGI